MSTRYNCPSCGVALLFGERHCGMPAIAVGFTRELRIADRTDMPELTPEQIDGIARDIADRERRLWEEVFAPSCLAVLRPPAPRRFSLSFFDVLIP